MTTFKKLPMQRETNTTAVNKSHGVENKVSNIGISSDNLPHLEDWEVHADNQATNQNTEDYHDHGLH